MPEQHYAIKSNSPNYYLEKGDWNWINTLDERTVYTGSEVVKRLFEAGNDYKYLGEQTQIILVQKLSTYSEVA